MASIFDSGSTLFSSLGNSSTNTSSSSGLYGINLSDYASIKNGSYGKLLKSYYALEDNDSDGKTNTKNDTDDTDSTLISIKSSASDLKKSAEALYSSKSLFEKDADGEYDMEAIYEKVNTFIEDYNSVIESVGSAETESIARAGANLVNATASNSDMLSKMGISINKTDYTLSIDKEKFLQANVSDIKSVFSGVGSFAYQVEAKASRIYRMVEDKVSTSGTYTSSRTETSSSTSKDNAVTIAEVKEKADNLVAYGTDLYKNRVLFKTDSEGNYDTNAILEEISGFVKEYNALILAGNNSKSSGIVNAIKTIQGITDNYKKELNALGITIDKENGTLAIEEKTFAQADMGEAKKLFSGNTSFVYEITAKAVMAAAQAETEANKSNTYTSTAEYSNNYNSGAVFNGTV